MTVSTGREAAAAASQQQALPWEQGRGTHEEHTKGLLLQEQSLSGEGRAGP